MQIPWNKGLTKETDMRVKKIANKTKIANVDGRCGMRNKKHTIETKEKMRLAHLGKHWKLSEEVLLLRKNVPRTKETKEKIRKWQIINPNRKFSNTKIEQKIAIELNNRKIAYQQNLGILNIANVDFFLPVHNIIIECDGDYWHNRPGAQENDKRKTRLLRRHGFAVYRFWERDINNSPERCIDMLKINAADPENADNSTDK